MCAHVLSISSFEALVPLICHLSLDSHAVQCASAHKQNRVTVLQLLHRGNGGHASFLEQTDYANLN